MSLGVKTDRVVSVSDQRATTLAGVVSDLRGVSCLDMSNLSRVFLHISLSNIYSAGASYILRSIRQGINHRALGLYQIYNQFVS